MKKINFKWEYRSLPVIDLLFWPWPGIYRGSQTFSWLATAEWFRDIGYWRSTRGQWPLPPGPHTSVVYQLEVWNWLSFTVYQFINKTENSPMPVLTSRSYNYTWNVLGCMTYYDVWHTLEMYDFCPDLNSNQDSSPFFGLTDWSPSSYRLGLERLWLALDLLVTFLQVQFLESYMDMRIILIYFSLFSLCSFAKTFQ